jgi:peroxin-10
MCITRDTSSNTSKHSSKTSWVPLFLFQTDKVGSRWLHSHQPILKAFSDATYLTLTTALGHRTLGEEYTDIYQISSTNGQKPSTLRRWGYVLTESAGWYILIHILWPRTRRHLQQKLDTASDQGRNTFREKFLRTSLAIIENTTSIHLALFYFLGTYYSLPKRLFQIRYVPPPHP